MRSAGTIAGGIWALAILLLSIVAAALPVLYLTEYGSTRLMIAGGTVLGGALVATLAFLLLRRLVRTRRGATLAIALLVVLLGIPVASFRWPGRITNSRFGLTVYGCVPVPALDVVIRPSGLLWFRDKNHLVTEQEVRSLLSPGVTRVIIGKGWRNAVRVEPGVRAIEGVEVWILRTPEAFDLFNESKDEGVRVLLIAHSTC